MPWHLFYTAADFRSLTDSIHHDQEDMIHPNLILISLISKKIIIILFTFK